MRLLPLTLAMLLLAVSPRPAQAAFASCAFDPGTHTVTATFGAGTTGAIARSGNAIVADGSACGGATVLNTDLVKVVGDPDPETLTLSLAGGPFAPGFTDEPGSSDEIEFEIELGTGSGQTIDLFGTSGADHIDAGVISGSPRTALNLNADEADGIDADLRTPPSAGTVVVHAGAGNDVLDDSGVPAPIILAATSSLRWMDEGGNDDVTVQSTAVPGAGNDTYTFTSTTGGGTLTYAAAPGPVTATLTSPGGGTAAGQDGFGDTDTYVGRVGPLTLTPFDDTLTATGTGRINLVSAGAGADVVTGGGMPDLINTGTGDDTLSGGGESDSLSGGDGDDEYHGGDGDDGLIDAGTGADTIDAGPGDDAISQTSGGSTPDDISGGPGRDFVQYATFLCRSSSPNEDLSSLRAQGVTVSLDDIANDGEPGEGDNVRSDVEDLFGTALDDTLVGDGDANLLYGYSGRDTLRGGGGDDQLYGLRAPCQFSNVAVNIGDTGDVLDGGPGADLLSGSLGDDVFAARDGVADQVDCGVGTDSVVGDTIDTFTACESVDTAAAPVVVPDPGTGPPTTSPAPGAAPPPGPTPTTAGTAPAPTFGVLGAAGQLLACARTRVVLVDVVRDGRKVRITGVATPSLFAGRSADILLAGKQVGSAKIGASGDLAATVPAPRAKGRPRYQLRIGKETSSRVVLDRRVVVDTIAVSGGKVVVRGRVVGPQAKTPAPIVFRRQTSCTTYVAAGKATPDRRGRFTARLPLPPGPATAAVYRGQTKVAKRRRGKATASSFTLARAVSVR